MLEKQAINSAQHFTEPPPRYSEASLVKRMEELGIGRPSTYAAILQVLQDRGYVRIEKKRLMPEDKGRVVVGFLESFFQRYVEYDFTANLEEQLDRVSNNEVDWKQVLQDFWIDFIGAVNEIKDLRVTAGARRAQRSARAAHLPAAGRRQRPAQMPELRNRPALAQARPLRRLHRLLELSGLQFHPADDAGRQWRRQRHQGAGRGSGHRAWKSRCARGRFGPYLQLGEQAKPEKKGDKVEKPKRAGLPKGLAPDDIDLEKALALLALPRDVGPHPEDGELIIAGVGRFGPYVKHGKTYANLDSNEDVLTVGLNRAVTLIAEKMANPGKGRRFGADPGRALGEHPDKGGPIVVKKGRYGPYVSHDGVNATLPADITPEDVTIEQAVGLLEARIAKGGGKKTRKKAAAKKPDKKAEKPAKAAKEKSEADRAGEGAAQATAPSGGQAARQGGSQSRGQAEEAGRPRAQGQRGGVMPLRRHARACPGHPCLPLLEIADVDARASAGHDRDSRLPAHAATIGWRSSPSTITFHCCAPFGAGPLLLTKASKQSALPSKADLLAFIREHPGKVGTREIARAFGLKNALRAELKRMLRDLADEGAIEKRRKKLHHAGALPATLLADVTARDRRRRPDRHARRMGRGEWAATRDPHRHPAPAQARRSRRPRRPRAAAAGRRTTPTA